MNGKVCGYARTNTKRPCKTPSFQDLPEHHSVTSSKVIGSFDKASFVSKRGGSGGNKTNPSDLFGHVEFSAPTEGLRALMIPPLFQDLPEHHSETSTNLSFTVEINVLQKIIGCKWLRALFLKIFWSKLI